MVLSRRWTVGLVTKHTASTTDPALVPGSFFSSCFGSILPTDLDLYVTELDINNEQYVAYSLTSNYL